MRTPEFRNRPLAPRTRLLQLLAAAGLNSAACGGEYATRPDLQLVNTFEGSDCALQCLEGEQIDFIGKNASQQMETQSCIVEAGVCTIEDPTLLTDQNVRVVMPETPCGALEIVDAHVENRPMPQELPLEHGVNLFEWKIVDVEKGECADDTTGGDSEGNDTGDIPCTEDADCYEKGNGLCDEETGECFDPTMCYASSAVKGATKEIRETPSDELVMGTDFKKKSLNDPNSPDGMDFRVYGGYLSKDGTRCLQVPDGLGEENVVEIRMDMEDPNNEGEVLMWTSQANSSFLQAADASKFAAMTDAQVFNADESLRIKGQIAITNDKISAKPGFVDTFAVNYNVEQ